MAATDTKIGLVTNIKAFLRVKLNYCNAWLEEEADLFTSITFINKTRKSNPTQETT